MGEEYKSSPKVQITLIDYVGHNRIPAIKALRYATGYGLKEAKDIVDALIDDHISHTFDFYPTEKINLEMALVEFKNNGIIAKVEEPENVPLPSFTELFSANYILKELIKKLVDDNEFAKVKVLSEVLQNPAFKE